MTHDIQLASQPWCTAVGRLSGIARVLLEELLLVLKCRSDRFGLIDVALATVYNGYVAKTQGNDSACENVDDVGSLVPIMSGSKSQFAART